MQIPSTVPNLIKIHVGIPGIEQTEATPLYACTGFAQFVQIMHDYCIISVMSACLQPRDSGRMASVMKYCFSYKDGTACMLQFKAAAALVHSIEYLGNAFFPEVRHSNQVITFACHLAECLPLQNAHQMEKCFR